MAEHDQPEGNDNYPSLPDRLLRIEQVIGKDGIIPVSRSAWYQGIKDGRFPKPVKLGPGMSRWRLSDVLAIVRSGV